MLEREGVKAFYKSFGVNYFMNVPFGALIVTINETLKQKYLSTTNNSLVDYYLLAGVAGLLAAVPTCPLDVIKTRLNVQNCMNKNCFVGGCSIFKSNSLNSPRGVSSHHNYDLLSHRVQRASAKFGKFTRYHSVVDAAKKIYWENGIKGFFRGLKMRILIQSPSSAISWGTYETCKRFLTRKA